MQRKIDNVTFSLADRTRTTNYLLVIILNPPPFIIETTQRSSSGASFRLKAIELAIQEGNCACAWNYGETLEAAAGRTHAKPKFEKSFQTTLKQVAWTLKCPGRLDEYTGSRWPRCIHCTAPTDSQNSRPQNEIWRFQSWAVIVFQIYET